MNPFTFPCTQCGRPLSATPDKVGRRAKCPACQTHFTIPPAPQVADVLAVDPPVMAPPPVRGGTMVAPLSPEMSPTPASPQAWPGSTQTPAPLPPPPMHTPTPRSKSEALVAPMTTQLISWRASERPLLQGLIALGVGAALTVAFYAFCQLFKSSRFYEIMSGRLSGVGWWITPLEVFFFAWACAILTLKMIKVRRERGVFDKDLLLRNVPTKISRDNAHQFLVHLKTAEKNPRSRFLTNRAWVALTHLKGGASTGEVANAVNNQSAIDASIVQSGYVMLKVFIWAIPILGFIGTVLGISAAIADFNEVTKAAEEMARLKDELGKVTAALAVAFNTTLVALVLSMGLMFWTSGIQKREEDLLTQADEFCNEQLLTKIQATGDDGAEAETLEAIRAVGEDARRAMERMESQRNDMAPEFAKQLEECAQRISESLERRGQEIAGENRDLTRQMAQSASELAPLARQLADALQSGATTQKQLTALHQVLEELRPALKRLAQPVSIQIVRDDKQG